MYLIEIREQTRHQGTYPCNNLISLVDHAQYTAFHDLRVRFVLLHHCCFFHHLERVVEP